MVGGGGIPGLAAARQDGPPDLQFVGRAHVKGKKKWIKHLLVTVDLLGLQLVWSTEMAYASPYLLSLGLSKSGMSAVFLAGPLSGLIVQPIIGAFADRSKSRFGRRRPIIVIGCVICTISLLIFGYTKEVASVFTTRGSNAHSTLTIWLAVFSVYALDFAINGVQAADRALIVDVLPISQQEEANAWAARVAGAGSILGFWIGNVDLTYAFSFLGSTQVKILSVFASLALVGCHAITCLCVEERVLLDENRTIPLVSSSAGGTGDSSGMPLNHEEEEVGLLRPTAFFTRERTRKLLKPARESLVQIWSTYRTLPDPIWHICKVQAFAWGGWFPILFFSTTYVAEIYAGAHPATGDGITISETADGMPLPHEADPGTRAGSRAMFLHSLSSFLMSVILPFCVNSQSILGGVSASSNAVGNGSSGARKSRTSEDRGSSHHRRNPLTYYYGDSVFLARLSSFLPTLPFEWLDLNLLWAISHVVFACLMFSTWFVGSVWSATLMLSILGFSWAVTCWAPTALLAQEILQDHSVNKPGRPYSTSNSRNASRSSANLAGKHSTGEDIGGYDSVATKDRSQSKVPSSPSINIALNGNPFTVEAEDDPDHPGSHSGATKARRNDQLHSGTASGRLSPRIATSEGGGGGSGSATPRRTYSATTNEDGVPVHPAPLEVSKRLKALIRSPKRKTSSASRHSPSSREPQSPVSPVNDGRAVHQSLNGYSAPVRDYPVARTLQIRHSDSFDGSNASYSDDDDDDDGEHEEVSDHLHTEYDEGSLSYPPLPGRSRLGNEAGLSTDTLRTASRIGNVLESGGYDSLAGTSGHRRMADDDADLDTLEAELGVGGSSLSKANQVRTADQAGAILGIANIFVVLPQFLTSFASSIIFAFMAPADKVDADLLDASSASDPLLRRASYSPRLSHYPRAAAAAGGIHVSASTNDGIGIIFRIGGVLALVAAWLCWQMRQKKRRAAAAAASGETVYL